MGSIEVIQGTGFSVTGIFVVPIDEDNSNAIGEVINVNEYGFFEIELYKTNRRIKRHLSDCQDVFGICVGRPIKGLTRLTEELFALSFSSEFKQVYFLRKPCNDGYEYIARTRTENKYTSNICLAWFTFDYEQAKNFAQRLTLKEFIAYDVVSSESIKLEEFIVQE